MEFDETKERHFKALCNCKLSLTTLTGVTLMPIYSSLSYYHFEWISVLHSSLFSEWFNVYFIPAFAFTVLSILTLLLGLWVGEDYLTKLSDTCQTFWLMGWLLQVASGNHHYQQASVCGKIWNLFWFLQCCFIQRHCTLQQKQS